MYSQNNEEKIITDFFGDFKGHLLDIGANDGQTLSNSRRLIELGWSGDLVEPSPVTYMKLLDLYMHHDDVYLHNVAITDQVGEIEFWDCGTHLNKGDTSLVSTASTTDYEKWKETTDWQKVKVQSVNFETLLLKTKSQTFDFITIDAEGYDFNILKQIDLDKTNTRLICIEHNQKQLADIVEYLKVFDFKTVHINNENVILRR
jgi:FkbM family methyltransferase